MNNFETKECWELVCWLCWLFKHILAQPKTQQYCQYCQQHMLCYNPYVLMNSILSCAKLLKTTPTWTPHVLLLALISQNKTTFRFLTIQFSEGNIIAFSHYEITYFLMCSLLIVTNTRILEIFILMVYITQQGSAFQLCQFGSSW